MKTDLKMNSELIHVMFRLKNRGMQLPNKYISSRNVDLNLTEFTFLMHLVSPHELPHPHPHHHHPHHHHDFECGMEKSGDVNLKDIRGFLCISKGAVSQTISSLEKKGYVTREINPDNRRKLNVIVTEKGITVLKDCQSDMDKMMLNILNNFGEENAKELIALLNKFADVMRDVESVVVEPEGENKVE